MNEPAGAPPDRESDEERDARDYEESDRGDRERKERHYPVTRSRVVELNRLSGFLDFKDAVAVAKFVAKVNGLCADLIEEMDEAEADAVLDRFEDDDGDNQG